MNIRSFFLEKEGDTPKDWISNTILERDGKGNIIERIVPNDENKEE